MKGVESAQLKGPRMRRIKSMEGTAECFSDKSSLIYLPGKLMVSQSAKEKKETGKKKLAAIPVAESSS